jgi:hypothetical protein
MEKLEAGFRQAESRFSGFNAVMTGLAQSLGNALFNAAGAAFQRVERGITGGIQGAIELNETLSKTRTIFGGSADVVINEADRMADAFGTSKNEYIEAAAGFGAVFKGVGKSQAEAAGLGNQLAKLGMDMASFDNRTNAEAFTAISSALRGEMDPIEKFRVFLTADAVAAEAMAMGLAKSKGELDANAKKMATLSLIMKQTKDHQGDLERTAGGAANQSRKFWGTIENLQTSIGMALLPAMTKLLNLLSEVASALSKSFGRGQDAVAGFAAMFEEAVDTVGVVYRNFGDIVSIVQLTVEEKLTNAGEVFLWLGDVIRAFLDWFVANWPTIFEDVLNASLTALRNLASNFEMIFDGIMAFLKDPSKGFDIKLKPILEGFEAKTTALKVPELKLTSLEAERQEIGARIEAREKERADRVADAAAKAKAAKPGEAEAAAAAAGKKEEKAAFLGVEEYLKGIQSAAFGKDKDKNAERTAKATEETAKGITRFLADSQGRVTSKTVAVAG